MKNLILVIFAQIALSQSAMAFIVQLRGIGKADVQAVRSSPTYPGGPASLSGMKTSLFNFGTDRYPITIQVAHGSPHAISSASNEAATILCTAFGFPIGRISIVETESALPRSIQLNDAGLILEIAQIRGRQAFTLVPRQPQHYYISHVECCSQENAKACNASGN